MAEGLFLPKSGASPYEAAETSDFTIEQLGGPRRFITLRGRFLPFRGVPFGVSQTHAKTKMPGGISIVQTLGADYPDTELSGCWRQMYLNTSAGDVIVDKGEEGTDLLKLGDRILTITALVEIMTRVVEEGQLVRVSWDAQVRYGLLAEFTPTFQRVEVVDWTMHFVWVSRVPPELKKGAFALPQTPSQAASWFDQLIGLADEFMKKLEWIADIAGFSKVTKVLNGIAYLQGQIVASVYAAAKLIITPIELARRIVQLATGIINQVGQALQDAGRMIIAACADLANAVTSARIGGFTATTASSSGSLPPGSPVSSLRTTAMPGLEVASQDGGAAPDGSTTPPIAPTGTDSNALTFPLVQFTPDITPFIEYEGPRAAETVSPGDPMGFETVPTLPVQTEGQTGDAGGGATGGGPVIDPLTYDTAVPYAQGPSDTIVGAGLATAGGAFISGQDFLDMLRSLQRKAAELRGSYISWASNELALRGVWVASGRDDLMDVAQRFYGSTAPWQQLQVFNGLSKALLEPGQVVLVPELS